MTDLILRPSAAHRWVYCAGSVQAEAQFPDEETDATREGNAAHWVGSEILIHYANNMDVQLASDYLDKPDPAGTIIDMEMIEGVHQYVNDVLQVAQQHGALRLLQIEETLQIPRVHPTNAEGTPDCWFYDAAAGVIYIWDFKYGRGVVEVAENWQLIDYAAGILDHLGINGEADQHVRVNLRIVQPRAFHIDGTVRHIEIPASDLRGPVNKLQYQGALALQADPPTVAGTHCDNCKARRGCSTLQNAAARTTDTVETLHLVDLTPAELNVEMTYLEKAADMIAARLEALDAQAFELMMSQGVMVPGRSIGTGRGSTKWNKPNVEVYALGTLLPEPVDLRQDKPITPKQAIALGVDEAVINAYSERIPGKARVVRSKDTIAGRVFGIK